MHIRNEVEIPESALSCRAADADTELAELAHANRVAAMGRLSASLVHEVNQPITAAVTDAHAALRWLGAHPPNLEEVRQALHRIVQGGNRASELVGRVRTLIMKEPPRQERLDLSAMILEVIGLARGEVMKNDILLTTRLAQHLPLIRGDRVQLQQVILNLIINAVEAMAETSEGPRELQIRTGESDWDGVVVAVRDSGPGVAPASLKRVFDAFYTTKPRGLGMGLSICRSIIDAHGGRLWATPNLPRGAVFQFHLPRDRAMAPL